MIEEVRELRYYLARRLVLSGDDDFAGLLGDLFEYLVQPTVEEVSSIRPFRSLLFSFGDQRIEVVNRQTELQGGHIDQRYFGGLRLDSFFEEASTRHVWL